MEPMWNNEMAGALKQTNQYIEMLAAQLRTFEKVKNAKTHYNLGKCYAEIGMKEKAIIYLTKSIQLESNHANAFI